MARALRWAVKYLSRLVVVAAVLALFEASGSMCVAQIPSYNQLANAASWGASSHGWRLGIIGRSTAFHAGQPIGIVALVRNTGQRAAIEPLEPQGFATTLVDSRGGEVTSAGEPMNSTGRNEDYVDTNSIVKNTLHINQRYANLPSGTYRLKASINIVLGNSMQPAPKPVFAHLTSGTITLTVLP
jgi:hypothetical protein